MLIEEINKVSGCGAVGSALPWGGRGRGFKSRHSDQLKTRYFQQEVTCLFCYGLLRTASLRPTVYLLCRL